jgi:enoyl-CoA hydratase
MSTGLSIDRRGRVAVITLDDGKANTMHPASMAALDQALTSVESSDAGALVITGRAGIFSAGLDLKVMPALGPDEMVAALRLMGRMLTHAFTCSVPYVAAVSGHALAGGAILALAADVRIAVDGPFRFGLNEVPIGLALPTFAAEIARAAIPVASQAEAILHGRIYSPAEAHARGILDALEPSGRVLEASVARAEALAGLPRDAYRGTKQRLRGPAVRASLEALEREIDEFRKGLQIAAR